jgi:hypothetical protein
MFVPSHWTNDNDSRSKYSAKVNDKFFFNTVVLPVIYWCLIHKLIARMNFKNNLLVTKRVSSLGKSG